MTNTLRSGQNAQQLAALWRKARRSIRLVAISLLALPVTAFSQAIYTTPYTFSHLAGYSGVWGVRDGTGRGARFNAPAGVALDTAGNVYVADSANSTTRLVTPTGVVTTIAGLATNVGSADGIGSAARFNHPSGVAVDSAGNVYVADSRNDTIRAITPAGVVTTLAGTAGVAGNVDGTGAAAQFFYPYGIAIDGIGNLYVADTDNSTIRLVTPAGVVTTLAGAAGTVGSVDGTGSSARFAYPYGVAIDGAGNLYVADTGNSTIRLIAPGGVVTTFAGLAGMTGTLDATGTEARFAHARGVAVDGAGNVYVADTDNSTIRLVTPAGIVTTVGGVPGAAGAAYGTGRNAVFDVPFGLAVNSTGDLCIADTEDETIRTGMPDPAADYLKSGVAITFPLSGQRVTNQPVVITGTTRNNAVVASVYIQLSGQAPMLAATTNSWGDWSVTVVTPNVGANTVRAYAVNTDGTQSPTVAVAFRIPQGAPVAFAHQQGTFNGLLLDSTDGTGSSSGFFTLTLAPTGAFSGKLLTAGTTYTLPTTNKFSGTGNAEFILPTEQGPLKFDLALNMSNPAAEQLTGTVSYSGGVANLTAHRAVSNTSTDEAANYGGRYTITLGGTDTATGHALVKVSPQGQITMIGSLSDGTAISQSVGISQDGSWPFYASYSPPAGGPPGAVMGWISLTNSPASSQAGTLVWDRPSGKADAIYQVGFTIVAPNR